MKGERNLCVVEKRCNKYEKSLGAVSKGLCECCVGLLGCQGRCENWMGGGGDISG